MDDTDLINKIGRKRYRRRLERDRYFTQAITPSSLAASPSPPARPLQGNMATTAAGNKLANEIHEEFLTCKICLEGFKQPKCLECLHTFCEQCIESHVLNECSYKKYSDYREFTCPLCRKRTQLPIGGVKKLPDNFLVCSLGEVVARQKPSKFSYCDICKVVNHKHREASSKCIDCNKLLCGLCVDMHKETKVTSGHSLFDVEIQKDIECKEHEDEVVRFYCEPCQTCICILCTFNEHKDHEITQFTEAVSKYKDFIDDLLSSCKGKIDVYDRQLALLSKVETVIKGAEQKIKDAAIHYIAEVRNNEKKLIDELHGMYGSELMEYVKRKTEMQNNLDGLKSTCNLTEMVLRGKDIELLLLKKQVQEKLSVMANIELQDLPNTVGKQVSFVEGNMDFGRLQDPDKEIEKKQYKDSSEIREEEPHTSQAQPTQPTQNNRTHLANEPKQPRKPKSALGLTNMTFSRRRRSPSFGDEHERVIESVIEITEDARPSANSVSQSTQSTQTDPSKTQPPAVRLVGRCVQTEFYIPEAGTSHQWRDPVANVSRSRFSSSQETRAVGTDTLTHLDKSSMTPSRTPRPLATTATSSRDESPPVMAESSSGIDAPTSPPRRHRRRRERPKPVDVSVRPTTGSAYQSSEGEIDVEPVRRYSRFLRNKYKIPERTTTDDKYDNVYLDDSSSSKGSGRKSSKSRSDRSDKRRYLRFQ